MKSILKPVDLVWTSPPRRNDKKFPLKFLAQLLAPVGGDGATLVLGKATIAAREEATNLSRSHAVGLGAEVQ